MTMLNVTLCLLLVGYFLSREDDLPARRPHRGRLRTRHWRRGVTHVPQLGSRPGPTGYP